MDRQNQSIITTDLFSTTTYNPISSGTSNLTPTLDLAKNESEENRFWSQGRTSPYSLVEAIIIASVLLSIIIGTIVGNLLVCVAVCLVKKLRRPCNYLLVSLAISDICVAVLVMPMATLYEILGKWTFGPVMCDLWVSFDVLSCTASILNLCMISVDRYYAITKPLQYGVKRTPKRMLLCVGLVWLVAACISLPPLLILGNKHDFNECMVSQNFGYQIYATLLSFYIPLTVMVTVYYKIFRAARRIVLDEKQSRSHLEAHCCLEISVRNGGCVPVTQPIMQPPVGSASRVQQQHRPSTTSTVTTLIKAYSRFLFFNLKKTKTASKLRTTLNGGYSCQDESFVIGFTNNNCLKYYSANYDEAYQRSWRLISEKIIYLLKRGPQTVMTFEPLYSQIYRTVCAGKSEKMFLDLMSLASKHLSEVDQTLGNVNEVSLEHFLAVSDAMRDYIGCTKKITLLFSYFNKKYVFNELSTDLFYEFGDVFHRTILERRMPALMIVAEEALEVPCSFSPTIFHRFCHDVWTVCNRRFAVQYPRVFSRYHMRVVPEIKESDQENNQAEIREFEDRVRERLAARSNQATERPVGTEGTH